MVLSTALVVAGASDGEAGAADREHNRQCRQSPGQCDDGRERTNQQVERRLGSGGALGSTTAVCYTPRFASIE